MKLKTIKSAFNELYDFKGFKICGFFTTKTKFVILLERTKTTGKCSRCKKTRRKVIEKKIRTIRDLNISKKKCYLKFTSYHIKCSCGYYGMEELEFVNRYDRYTKRFATLVANLCTKMSLKDVAEITRINWKTAKKIDKQNLQGLVKNLKDVIPIRIGADEIAYEKGHKYLTLVRDLEAGIIWVGEGRKKETLNKFFNELGKTKCKKINVAVVDMWDPYIASIKENTNAEIVFDKFHVAKKINDVVDKVRKQEFAKADDVERKMMKHKRFLILARQKRLDNKQREEIQSLMEQNTTLYTTYLMKEQGLDIFDEQDKNTATERFQKWIENVIKTEIEQFNEVIKTIKKYFYGILNYFTHRITNSASEGYNTKITVIKRRAYGFRDLEYFRLKILQSCS